MFAYSIPNFFRALDVLLLTLLRIGVRTPDVDFLEDLRLDFGVAAFSVCSDLLKKTSSIKNSKNSSRILLVWNTDLFNLNYMQLRLIQVITLEFLIQMFCPIPVFHRWASVTHHWEQTEVLYFYHQRLISWKRSHDHLVQLDQKYCSSYPLVLLERPAKIVKILIHFDAYNCCERTCSISSSWLNHILLVPCTFQQRCQDLCHHQKVWVNSSSEPPYHHTTSVFFSLEYLRDLRLSNTTVLYLGIFRHHLLLFGKKKTNCACETAIITIKNVDNIFLHET